MIRKLTQTPKEKHLATQQLKFLLVVLGVNFEFNLDSNDGYRLLRGGDSH